MINYDDLLLWQLLLQLSLNELKLFRSDHNEYLMSSNHKIMLANKSVNSDTLVFNCIKLLTDHFDNSKLNYFLLLFLTTP